MDRESLRDEDLLERSLAGDEQSFAVLMRRHEDKIFGLASRMMGDRSDALEATQDTFIAAYKRGASFRGESAFSTWLYRIGMNACRDLLRKRRRDPTPQEELPEPRPTGARSLEDAAALRSDLAEALARVPEDYREAVVMHDLGGIPYEEIAEVTGVPLGTVKSRISRGRRALAALLEPPGSSATSNRYESAAAEPPRTEPK